LYAIVQFLIYFGILLAITKPLGAHKAILFAGERVSLAPVMQPVERGIYRATGVNERQERRLGHDTAKRPCLFGVSLVDQPFALVKNVHIQLIEEPPRKGGRREGEDGSRSLKTDR